MDEDIDGHSSVSPEPIDSAFSYAEDKVPDFIGSYKIESLLEKGGMSILYLATHPTTKEPVTIKVLSPKYLSHPDAVKRFLNEAEIIALADHPNIVKLYGHGNWAEGLFIAMEFIQGISLRQYILQTPLSLKKALEMIIEIAYALCHLHTHGVIHRDLKPENILVTEEGHIKVIDFGIAQLLSEAKAEDKETRRRLIGTPIYMSPEQQEDPEQVSFPSDIYSLGIISYELVLGRLCHGQVHLSLMPRGIQKILNISLQPKPEERYQDIVDFITDITNYLHSANLGKETKAADKLSEFSESLQEARKILLPSLPPDWKGVEVGMASVVGVASSDQYIDFFKMPNHTYSILMGESSAKGADSILYSAIFRGMARALARLTADPEELISSLNELLISDNIEQVFSLQYIILQPKENKYLYICCGLGNLWHHKIGYDNARKVLNENIALGISSGARYKSVTHRWTPGDILFLTGFPVIPHAPKHEWEVSESEFIKAVQESYFDGAQKKAEGILRKTRLSLHKTPPERAITLLCIGFNV